MKSFTEIRMIAHQIRARIAQVLLARRTAPADGLPKFKGKPRVACPVHGERPSPSFSIGRGSTVRIRGGRGLCPDCRKPAPFVDGVYRT